MATTPAAALAALLLVATAATAQTAEDPTRSATSAIASITDVCEADGMLACEPQIHGADLLFDYIRALNQLSLVEREFKNFLEQEYPEEDGIDFDILQATMDLSLDVTLTPENLTRNIRSVEETSSGYDIHPNSGGAGVMKLRKRDGLWHLYAPPGMESQLSQLQPFYRAAQLKRSILTYRMLEAQIAGLSKDALEARISEDLAPILIAVLGEENVPAAVRWLSRDLREVISFYWELDSIEAMEARVRKIHHLQ